jgi:thiamine-monophosphate kinase
MSERNLPNEFELIARYFAPLARSFPGAYGLLDDAAVISPSAGAELVVKTDVIVSGVDFPPGTAADLVARKALRVNLSDLAAKGALPRAYLLDLVIPDTVDEAWIAAFAKGLAQDQAEYQIALIGGDLSSTSGPIVVGVTALGEAPIGCTIRRGGARPDDVVFVTGTIGDAALGLSVLQGALPALESSSAAFLRNRYRLPEPRVALGPRLVGLANASIDVSDGLVADLRHLSEVSGLDAIVAAESVPLSPAARAAIAGDPRRLATALTGGDDYETVGPQVTSTGHDDARAGGDAPRTCAYLHTLPGHPDPLCHRGTRRGATEHVDALCSWNGPGRAGRHRSYRCDAPAVSFDAVSGGCPDVGLHFGGTKVPTGARACREALRE